MTRGESDSAAGMQARAIRRRRQLLMVLSGTISAVFWVVYIVVRVQLAGSDGVGFLGSAPKDAADLAELSLRGGMFAGVFFLWCWLFWPYGRR